MKKAAEIIKVEAIVVNGNEYFKVTYKSGVSRKYETYKAPKTVKAWIENKNEDEECEGLAWAEAFMAKGKSLEQLEKAIMRKTAAEIARLFRACGCSHYIQSKTEMLSIIITVLLDRGYRWAA